MQRNEEWEGALGERVEREDTKKRKQDGKEKKKKVLFLFLFFFPLVFFSFEVFYKNM